MPDNYAGLHKRELIVAIDAAPDDQTLQAIDADLAREGWSASGVLRKRIAARQALIKTPRPTTVSQGE